MISYEELDDLRMEAKALKRARKRYRCSDGFCGAEDCKRCYPCGRWGRDEIDNLFESNKE